MGKTSGATVQGSLGSSNSSKSEHESLAAKDKATDNHNSKQEADVSSIASDKALTQSISNSKSTSGIEKSLPSSQIVVCKEVFDEHSEPTEAGMYHFPLS